MCSGARAIAIAPGDVFGHLTVVSQAESDKHYGRRWHCRCECGGVTIALTASLRRGRTRSCGCRQRRRTHGMHGTPTYTTWRNMQQRCHNPNAVNFDWYGGRGVTVCKRWQRFETFLNDMGERPRGCTLDRIDPEGDYEPNNCQWADSVQQATNKRPRRDPMAEAWEQYESEG